VLNKRKKEKNPSIKRGKENHVSGGKKKKRNCARVLGKKAAPGGGGKGGRWSMKKDNRPQGKKRHFSAKKIGPGGGKLAGGRKRSQRAHKTKGADGLNEDS